MRDNGDGTRSLVGGESLRVYGTVKIEVYVSFETSGDTGSDTYDSDLDDAIDNALCSGDYEIGDYDLEEDLIRGD